VPEFPVLWGCIGTSSLEGEEKGIWMPGRAAVEQKRTSLINAADCCIARLEI